MSEQLPEATSQEDTPQIESSLRIELDYDARVHFAMHQSGVPVVKELRLHNDGEEDLGELEVELRIGAGLAQPWQQHLDLLRAGSSYRLRAADLALDAEKLRYLEEREQTQIEVRVTRAGSAAEEASELLAAHTEPVELLAFREWAGLRSLPALLAAYVLPNHPVIRRLHAATATCQEQDCGRGSLPGYQSRDPEHMRQTLRAAYRALREMGIRYANPPASFEEEGQKLRLPGDIAETRLGTCLDLALLAAGLLEAIGLNTLLIVIDGHAFVGVWKVEESFAEGVVDDAMRLRKRVDLDDVCVFEATDFTTDGCVEFEEAEKHARAHLDDESKFRVAIDIAQARKQRIRPLPTRSEESAAGEEAPLLGTAQVLTDGPLPETRPGAEAGGSSQEDPLGEPVDTPLGTGPGDESPEEQIPESERHLSPEERRIESWKRRLLDLTYRNRLLAFKESKRSVPLLLEDCAQLEDALQSGKAFVLSAKPELVASELAEAGPAHDERDSEARERQALQERARSELSSRRLSTRLRKSELDKRVLELWRQHRSSIEETGANTLHLALGMLRYRESPYSDRERTAPLLLLPLEIERRSVREGFRLQLADEDPQINATLLEKLRSEFGLDVRGLDVLQEDDAGVDVAEILKRFRRAIVQLDGFELRDEAWIAVLSFQKFLMWRDLQAHADALLENDVVAHLVRKSGAAFEPEEAYPEPDELDAQQPVHETLCPLDADSSQLAAVMASRAGRSFVLEGPPGTGKSQTITNLIAQNLAEGRRVLFVSEKRAALEVVRERLGRIGLGPFCLELHSNKASKRDVLEQLRQATEIVRTQEPADWDELCHSLERERKALNDYVQEMHCDRPLGESVYRVTSELCGLRDVPRIGLKAAADAQLSREWVTERRAEIERLRVARQSCGPIRGHSFAPVQRREWRATLPDELDVALRQALEQLAGLEEPALELAGRLGLRREDLSFVRIGELVTLAAQLLEPRSSTRELLEGGSWAELEEDAQRAIAAGRAKDAQHAKLAKSFADSVLELPLAELRQKAGSAAGTFWPLSWLRGRSVRSALQPHLAPGGRLGGYAEIAAALDQALELARQQRGSRGVRACGGPALRPALARR
jgi:hypothetical protein